jgi:hypothetical protein
MTDANGGLIKGKTGDWEMVIGLEVHAQVTSQSKLFSGAATAFGAAPNSQVSLVDAAMPGMLPVINGHSVERSRSSARARSSSTCPTARPSGSASSACTWSRTRASPCTTSTRP